MQPREPLHLWAGRVAVLLGLLCVPFAAITGATSSYFFLGATVPSLLLAGACALLSAIWLGLDEQLEGRRG